MESAYCGASRISIQYCITFQATLFYSTLNKLPKTEQNPDLQVRCLAFCTGVSFWAAKFAISQHQTNGDDERRGPQADVCGSETASDNCNATRFESDVGSTPFKAS
jgi:hypothetical protein